MSLIRRTAAKEKKASKNDTTKINLESVLQKLQRDEQLLVSGVRVNVYLTDQTEKSMCKCYMRTEDCRVKKCKLSHEGMTVFHLKNIIFDGSSSGVDGLQESEKACLPPIPLEEVVAKDSSKIMFISIGKDCVFDYMHPEIWHEWVALNRPASVAKEDDDSKRERSNSNLRPPLPPLEEETGDGRDDDNERSGSDDSDDGDEKEKHLAINVSSSSSKGVPMKGMATRFFSAEGGEGKGTASIFSFLTDEDLVAFLCCSKMSKGCCLRDELVRGRKKEAIAAYSHNVSKKKKEEKRKKAKNACISKVDDIYV